MSGNLDERDWLPPHVWSGRAKALVPMNRARAARTFPCPSVSTNGPVRNHDRANQPARDQPEVGRPVRGRLTVRTHAGIRRASSSSPVAPGVARRGRIPGIARRFLYSWMAGRSHAGARPSERGPMPISENRIPGGVVLEQFVGLFRPQCNPTRLSLRAQHSLWTDLCTALGRLTSCRPTL